MANLHTHDQREPRLDVFSIAQRLEVAEEVERQWKENFNRGVQAPDEEV